MQIEKRFEEDILVISLSGDFDTTEVDSYDAEIQSAVEAGYVRILLDLANLRFVNSTALGAMLTSQKRAAQFGGGIAAVNAQPTVSRTLRLLGLDQKISLRNSLPEALSSLRNLSPESVSTTGEEVEFFRPNSEDTFGARPRRGRLEEMHEEGLAFSFENLDNLDPEIIFAVESPLQLRFLLPLYHPTHVFKAGGKVRSFETIGRNTVLVHVDITALSEPEREAIRQYVKDLKLIKGEGN
jgi:anti-sigma B factor antagonist